MLEFLRGFRCLVRGHRFPADYTVVGRLWMRTCTRCGHTETYLARPSNAEGSGA